MSNLILSDYTCLHFICLTSDFVPDIIYYFFYELFFCFIVTNILRLDGYKKNDIAFGF